MSWVEEKGNWKWFDENGKQLFGWFLSPEDNRYYYLCSDTVQTDWFQDSDGRWYYFSPKKQIIDGKQYYLGQMITGWMEYNGKQCYLYDGSRPDLGIYRGQLLQDGTYTMPYNPNKKYTFDKDGYLVENNSLVSDACIDFIKSWEGYYAKPYYDCVGVKTLGYGMTGEEIEGIDYVTEEQATQMLKDWINKKYAPPIKKDLDSKGVTLKQCEFDSLISFCYNCGVGALLGSTLYKNVVNGVRNSGTIMSNFTAWSNGGGRRIEGLYRRRVKEAKMFLYGDYTGNN